MVYHLTSSYSLNFTSTAICSAIDFSKTFRNKHRSKISLSNIHNEYSLSKLWVATKSVKRTVTYTTDYYERDENQHEDAVITILDCFQKHGKGAGVANR